MAASPLRLESETTIHLQQCRQYQQLLYRIVRCFSYLIVVWMQQDLIAVLYDTKIQSPGRKTVHACIMCPRTRRMALLNAFHCCTKSHIVLRRLHILAVVFASIRLAKSISNPIKTQLETLEYSMRYSRPSVLETVPKAAAYLRASWLSQPNTRTLST